MEGRESKGRGHCFTLTLADARPTLGGMAEARKRLSTGCIIALVLSVLCGLCVLVPVVYLLGAVVMMNFHQDDFAAFDHLPPGTSLSEVVRRAEDLGFVRERSFGAVDGGVENIVFQKVVVPPFGRWFINVTTSDWGIVSVHTSTLD